MGLDPVVNTSVSPIHGALSCSPAIYRRAVWALEYTPIRRAVGVAMNVGSADGTPGGGRCIVAIYRRAVGVAMNVGSADGTPGGMGVAMNVGSADGTPGRSGRRIVTIDRRDGRDVVPFARA